MIRNSFKHLSFIILLMGSSVAFAVKPIPKPPEPPPCTAITSLPYVIDSEGVYCFTGNLSINAISGKAITINVDNVVLDLKGWMLDGLGAGTLTKTEGIYAKHRSNITIRNGTIRGFYYGIFLHGSPDISSSIGHLIEDIRAVQNRLVGILVLASQSVIRRNQVLETGGSTVATSVSASGIDAWGTGLRFLNNDITNTTATGTGSASGISLYRTDGVVVEGNRIANVSNDTVSSVGLSIRDSVDVLIIGNRITNADMGIFYNTQDGACTGKYRDNLTSGVTTPFTGGTDAGGNN